MNSTYKKQMETLNKIGMEIKCRQALEEARKKQKMTNEQKIEFENIVNKIKEGYR